MVDVNNLIKINKKHGGVLIDRSNLEFAVDSANKEKDIYKSNAYLIRGVIVNHPFLDGNKSTASEIVLKRFKKEGIKCNREKFSSGLISIAKNNIGSIDKIERRLKRWCPRK
ncbi:MAG: Fic family protein [Nanoarchaeota archaeon]|nr:Fic family protein [Nanoarchaeota archaeon]